MERWKDGQGVQATYGNLLEVFQKARHSQCAEVVREVLKKRTASPPRSQAMGALIFGIDLKIILYCVVTAAICVFISFLYQ